MGRKTNPKILRIGSIIRSWDSKWFAENRVDYKDKLLKDLAIRNYLNEKLRLASISRVEILRQPRETVLTIHSSRPAVIIGRGGSGIEKIQKDLVGILGKSREKMRINVQEVRNPDTDAVSVSTQVVDQLERRMPFRRVLKQSIQRSIQAGAKGVKIALAGRLNGAEIARTEWLSEGNVPLHTFKADISYSQATAHTTYGTIGVKVWINRGELLAEKEEEEEEGTVKKPKEIVRRRQSLANRVSPKTKAAPRVKSK